MNTVCRILKLSFTSCCSEQRFSFFTDVRTRYVDFVSLAQQAALSQPARPTEAESSKPGSGTLLETQAKKSWYSWLFREKKKEAFLPDDDYKPVRNLLIINL